MWGFSATLPYSFNENMQVFFDMEAYTWGIGLPTIASLDDNTKNTQYVDWIHTYMLTDNLIGNSGFETGSLSPWTSWGTVSVASSNSYSGTKAVYVYGSGAAQQIITVSPNTTYTLAGWGKVTAAGQSALLGVKEYGGTETTASFTGTSYTQESVTFTTGSTNTTAKIYFYVPNAAHQAYGDAFQLYKNIISNADFETGSLSPWTSWGTVSVASSNSYSGTKAVYINGSGGPEQIITVSPNTTYTLFGWGKVMAAGQSVLLGVKEYGGTETTASFTGTSYTQESVTFTTGSTNTTAKIYFYVPNAAHQAYGDAVIIRQEPVINPDFETGSLSPWTSWGTVSVCSNSYLGTKAVYINGVGAAEQEINVQPNTTYTLSAWGKVSAAGQSAVLGVEAYGGTPVTANFTATAYTQKSVTFTTGPYSTTAKIYLYVNNAAYQAYGDCFKLYIEGGPQYSPTGINSPTGLTQLNFFDGVIKTYPNPAMNYITIEATNSGYTISNAKIIDLQGKIIYYENNLKSKSNINISNLQTGLYLVKLTYENGAVSDHKFIKE
ncbi:MAG: carbohydrate binding domain-containing protein [Bacteroidales bacterium]